MDRVENRNKPGKTLGIWFKIKYMTFALFINIVKRLKSPDVVI